METVINWMNQSGISPREWALLSTIVAALILLTISLLWRRGQRKSALEEIEVEAGTVRSALTATELLKQGRAGYLMFDSINIDIGNGESTVSGDAPAWRENPDPEGQGMYSKAILVESDGSNLIGATPFGKLTIQVI